MREIAKMEVGGEAAELRYMVKKKEVSGTDQTRNTGSNKGKEIV